MFKKQSGKMSESRDNGAVLDHKGGKRIKYSDDQPGEDEDEDEEEDEEKGKEVSRGGNEGSSTATDTEEGETKLSGEENAVLPIKKRLHSLSTPHFHEETDDGVAPELESKSRDSSEKPNREEAQGRASIDCNSNAYVDVEFDDDDFVFDTDWSTVPLAVFLFEFQLTRSNRLLIPAKEAADFFPSLGDDRGAAQILQLTDDQNHEWNVAFVYYEEEESFMIVEGWPEFANWHKLKPTDWLRFYRPFPRLSTNHYLIKLDRRNGENGKKPVKTAEFRRENFLFLLELTPGDIGYSRLFIPRKQVAIHFPDVRILRLSRDKVTMKFTDEQNKDWYMDIILYDSDSYMVIEGWVEFVKEHNLEAMNVIKFYKPVQPSHKKHFLIQCVREKVARINGTQPGSPNGRDGDHGRGRRLIATTSKKTCKEESGFGGKGG